MHIHPEISGDCMVTNTLFNTKPIVMHANGTHTRKPYWPEIRDAFFASPRRSIGPSKNLTILTWNNGHEVMGLAERSLEHLGVPCMVVGAGVDDWVNSKHKPLLSCQAVHEIETEYVMGMDSRDAILLDDPAIIVERFEQNFSCDLLFSADRFNWPNLPEFMNFEKNRPEVAGSEFCFLNGGMWIGKTSFCRTFFSDAANTDPVESAQESEQGILKQLFPKYYPRVQLDYQCEIFQNLGFVFSPIFEVSTSRSCP